MSAARGRANQSLYLARILLDAWGAALDRQELPAGVICQAYLPAVRLHLGHAYGWFLLAIVQADRLPEGPPARSGELPPVPDGKVVPGEIRELSQLESSGWLADMLASAGPVAPAGPGRRDNLVVAAPSTPGLEEARDWLARLGALFERMGDSLDEY
jgi:hypothetical protein